MKQLIELNETGFILGVLKNIEREMPKAKRKRMTNIQIVMRYLLARTEKAGRTSCYEQCQLLEIDPDGFTFFID